LDNDAPLSDRNKHMNIPFSEHELKRALRQSKKDTSPGEDGIPYECLKQLPGTGQRTLLKLYNMTWEKGQIPQTWKHAIVFPVAKPGKDPHEPSSYRPIALTPTLCKVMERLVANRLLWYLEMHNILTNVQIPKKAKHCRSDNTSPRHNKSEPEKSQSHPRNIPRL